ncbi:Chromosome replication initiation protein DnaD [Paenibacillus pasadenensis]|uniref:Chromosome replication initiation protein DnaD n=1 Tax=Paenibacillus pasadenensis TaxID=217090 RepID=A0A2N5N5Y4_9BACL|nr:MULTISPECIES: DnaD domain-containing protein [Paenibacillus]PLT45699.1 Chromosome replication initiation protein DnaD [Paenibacillus pasadenensis]QGG56143.1 DnaD domain protein [Paenibacillus sp. B01]
MRPGDRGSSVSGSGAHAEALARVMGEGGVFLPALLLRSYRELGLGDADFMLLLQLMAFRDTERNDFPTPEELATRLGISPRSVQQQLGRLMKEGFLRIDETLDSVSGIRYERYNWQGWLERAAEWTAEADRSASVSASAAPSPRPAAAAAATDLFSVFEQEFGRPLSPMECERISMWLDQDRYSDELIRFALREAVFAGKLHFTYIDRILLEWGRNRVTTPEEARVHSRKFRGGAK